MIPYPGFLKKKNNTRGTLVEQKVTRSSIASKRSSIYTPVFRFSLESIVRTYEETIDLPIEGRVRTICCDSLVPLIHAQISLALGRSHEDSAPLHSRWPLEGGRRWPSSFTMLLPWRDSIFSNRREIGIIPVIVIHRVPAEGEASVLFIASKPATLRQRTCRPAAKYIFSNR